MKCANCGRKFCVCQSDAFARATDPTTSHAGAATVDVNALERMVVVSLRASGPATSTQVAERIGRDKWSISPRFAPLEAKGLIVRTGEKNGRSEIWAAK